MTKVKFDYEEYRGQNVFAVLSGFTRAAKAQGLSTEEIKTVIDEGMTGDYDNVFKSIAKRCE
jgi:hypothetical protein